MPRTKCFSRRKLCWMLPALAATASGGFGAQEEKLTSKCYPFESLPEHKSGENLSWPVLNGLTHENIPLEVHETQLTPGDMPHPPHRHLHEEMFLMREGTVELTINGSSTRLGPGGVGFVASNDLHGVRNIGSTPARYFVIAFGDDR
jgi:quercetin dioxygenase-like cupin family protein